MVRSRALLAKLVALMLLLGIVQPAHAASVKAGSKCTSLGTTTVTSGKTHTCIRSGSKLVWDSGVYVITFENLDPKYVRAAAFAQINKEMQGAASYAPDVNFVIGPSLKAKRVQTEKAALGNTMKFWGDIFRPSTRVHIGYYTEKDINWVDTALCTSARYCPTGMAPVVSNVIRMDLPECKSALATTNLDGQPFFEQCLGKGSEDGFSKQTGPHEYTHWAQGKYVIYDHEPNWFIEGGATYFGITLGTWQGATLPKTLDSMFHSAWNMWIRQTVCPITSVSVPVVTNCLQVSDQPGTPPNGGWTVAQLSYYMGALATEALIAVGGIDKYKNFLQSLASDAEFEIQFQESYGIALDTFYSKVAPYIVAMSNAGR